MAKRKRRESVTHKIMSNVISILNEKTAHDLTRKNYIRHCKKYIAFCREQYNCKDFESCREHIQDYSDYLQASGQYSAASIHTFLAAPCVVFDIPMNTIQKPIRHIGEFSRGRTKTLNHTNQDLSDPEYKRIVEFQRCVGVRRAELAKITGDCLVTDESGYPCILVKNGKGNKVQLQRLNKPEDLEFIKPYFEGKATDELIFTDKEINNNLNFHKLRALSAQEYYDIQLERILNEPGYAEQMVKEIEARWNRFNIDKSTGKSKPFNKSKLEGWYVTRGTVRQNAIKNNRPIKYNRLAVYMVSLYKNSHFRSNVTVENYLAI